MGTGIPKDLSQRVLGHPAVACVVEEIAGRGRPVYLVGGALRDAVLNRPASDFDFVTEGDPRPEARRLARILGARFVVLHETWGVARVLWSPGGERAQSVIMDFAPQQGSSIEEDLSRRDFSCNAMALLLGRETPAGDSPVWKDPCGGMADLREKRVRMVRPSGFVQDPVRLLRAFRLAAALGFTLDPETLLAIREHSVAIRSCAAERIGDELFKFLGSPGSFDHLLRMDDCGLLPGLFPELQTLEGLEQGRHHGLDAWRHSLECYRVLEEGLACGFPELKNREPVWSRWIAAHRRTEALLKLAALFHDLGKPATRSMEQDGAVHFHGHAEKGSRMVPTLMRRIRASRQDQERVRTWVRYHLGPLNLLTLWNKGNDTERAQIRFLRKLGPDAAGVLLLSWADLRARGVESGENRDASRALFDSLFRLLAEMQQDGEPSGPLIAGRDLIAGCGLPAGPLIGRLLRRVEEERLQGRVKNREEALAFVRTLLEEKGRAR